MKKKSNQKKTPSISRRRAKSYSSLFDPTEHTFRLCETWSEAPARTSPHSGPGLHISLQNSLSKLRINGLLARKFPPHKRRTFSLLRFVLCWVWWVHERIDVIFSPTEQENLPCTLFTLGHPSAHPGDIHFFLLAQKKTFLGLISRDYLVGLFQGSGRDYFGWNLNPSSTTRRFCGILRGRFT